MSEIHLNTFNDGEIYIMPNEIVNLKHDAEYERFYVEVKGFYDNSTYEIAYCDYMGLKTIKSIQ